MSAIVAVFLQKEAWRTLSNTSMEMDEESLADVRRDDTIKTRCVRFGVDYIERRHGETSAEQQQRHNTLQKAIERERKRRARAQQSPEELRSTQDLLHESEQEHSNRLRYVDRHRMQTLLHESEQEHSNRKRNETMEGVRIEKHAGGKDQ